MNLPGTAAPAPPPVPGVFATPGAIDATMSGCNGATFSVFIAEAARRRTTSRPPERSTPIKRAADNLPQVLAAAGGRADQRIWSTISHHRRAAIEYDFLVTDSTGGIDNFHISCKP